MIDRGTSRLSGGRSSVLIGPLLEELLTAPLEEPSPDAGTTGPELCVTGTWDHDSDPTTACIACTTSPVFGDPAVNGSVAGLTGAAVTAPTPYSLNDDTGTSFTACAA